MPGQRQEVQHREEVDQGGDGEHAVAALDELLGADLELDRRIERHEIMQLEDGGDLEEGEGEGRAARREDQVPQQRLIPEHELARGVVEELSHHRIGHQRQHHDLGGA